MEQRLDGGFHSEASALGDVRSANRLLAALPADVFALLQAHLKEIALPQGAVCFETGAPVDQVYFPHEGTISLMVATREGAMVETCVIGREGAAGMQVGFGDRLSFTTAQVQIGGRFSTVSAVCFQKAAKRSPALREIIIRYIETLWAEAQQAAVCHALHDTGSRLCRLLLQIADRTGIDELLITQERLAQMLSVRRTTVTIAAKPLQEKGLVRYFRGKITIIDRAALAACACECYEATRHDGLCTRISNGGA